MKSRKTNDVLHCVFFSTNNMIHLSSPYTKTKLFLFLVVFVFFGLIQQGVIKSVRLKFIDDILQKNILVSWMKKQGWQMKRMSSQFNKSQQLIWEDITTFFASFSILCNLNRKYHFYGDPTESLEFSCSRFLYETPIRMLVLRWARENLTVKLSLNSEEYSRPK